MFSCSVSLLDRVNQLCVLTMVTHVLLQCEPVRSCQPAVCAYNLYIFCVFFTSLSVDV